MSKKKAVVLMVILAFIVGVIILIAGRGGQKAEVVEAPSTSTVFVPAELPEVPSYLPTEEPSEVPSEPVITVDAAEYFNALGEEYWGEGYSWTDLRFPGTGGTDPGEWVINTSGFSGITKDSKTLHPEYQYYFSISTGEPGAGLLAYRSSRYYFNTVLSGGVLITMTAERYMTYAGGVIEGKSVPKISLRISEETFAIIVAALRNEHEYLTRCVQEAYGDAAVNGQIGAVKIVEAIFEVGMPDAFLGVTPHYVQWADMSDADYHNWKVVETYVE